jgi:hypothetical protein
MSFIYLIFVLYCIFLRFFEHITLLHHIFETIGLYYWVFMPNRFIFEQDIDDFKINKKLSVGPKIQKSLKSIYTYVYIYILIHFLPLY